MTARVRLSTAGAVRRSADERSVRLASGVWPREELNALRDRLPRSARREVDPVPLGHVGLIVQAIAGVDSPLLTVYGHVRADADPADALRELECRLLRRLR